MLLHNHLLHDMPMCEYYMQWYIGVVVGGEQCNVVPEVSTLAKSFASWARCNYDIYCNLIKIRPWQLT